MEYGAFDMQRVRPRGEVIRLVDAPMAWHPKPSWYDSSRMTLRRE